MLKPVAVENANGQMVIKIVDDAQQPPAPVETAAPSTYFKDGTEDE